MVETKNIEELAQKMVEKFNPEDNAFFPFQKILKKEKGLEIVETERLPSDMVGIFGYLQESDTFYIFVDKNRDKEKRSFAIAHGLGHYFLHCEEVLRSGASIVDRDPGAVFYSEEFWIMECEANIFASGLMMPEYRVKREWKKLRGVTKVGDCAKKFCVPIFEMVSRLKYLKMLD